MNKVSPNVWITWNDIWEDLLPYGESIGLSSEQIVRVVTQTIHNAISNGWAEARMDEQGVTWYRLSKTGLEKMEMNNEP